MKPMRFFVPTLATAAVIACGGPQVSRPVGISALDVPTALRQGATLVDLRASAAYDERHILGATNITTSGADEGLYSLPEKFLNPNTCVILYSSARAESPCLEAATKLRKQAFSGTYVVEGGYEALVRSGLLTVARTKIALNRG